MLTVCYSTKGGQGCTTVTAALALAQRGSRLIDTTGDLPALLGIPEPSGPGICDLLADDRALDALRRAVAHTVRPDGVVLVIEPDRALGSADVEAVLTAPVVARVSIDPTVARTIDAGLFAAQVPRGLARTLATLNLGDEVASRA